jgi:hypothetical protein
MAWRGRIRLGLWLSLVLVSVQVHAVTIYRIGGQDLPPPSGVGQPGVKFRQLSWLDVGRDGESYRLDVERQGISPQQSYAFSSLPLRDYNSGLAAPLFDWNALVCGVCRSLTARSYKCGVCRGLYGEQGTINFSLGDALFVERVRIRSGDPDGLGILQDFGLYLSPDPLATDAGPRRPFTIEVKGNDKGLLDLEGFSTERRTASIQLALPEHDDPVEINEVFVYAGGAATRALFVSPIIDFGRPALWGGMRWSLQQETGSRVTVSARGGDQAESLRYWRYTGIGDQAVEVTLKEYDKLRSKEKAGASYDYDSWTGWASAFDLTRATGEPSLPRSPRRAFQVQLEFSTTGVVGSRLESLEFRASDPAVSRVVGELDPIRVKPGVATEFAYILKPSMVGGDSGFDRLRIDAVAAQIDSVIGVWVDDVEVPFTVESLASDHLLVGFAEVTAELTDAPVEVRFRARVLRFGAAFAAFLADSGRPYDVAQPVPAGDAVDEIFSDRVWIETKVEIGSVLASRVEPATFTPNGDGLNDVVRIDYDLFETTGQVPLSVVIHDLSGRRLRRLFDGGRNIGHYELTWDGRDDAGRLVSPGIYLYRVGTRIGGRDEARLGMVHVLY